MNIAEILKNAPKFVSLYSPIFGEVFFNEVTGSNMICVIKKGHLNEDIHLSFYEDGKYSDFPGADCVLFPSKESADWDFFKEQLKRNVTLTTNKQKSVKEVLDMIYKWLVVNGKDYVYLDEVSNDKTYTLSLDVNGLFEAIEELVEE